MEGRSSRQMVAEAAAAPEQISPGEAVKLIGKPDVVFVDVRDQSEIEKTRSVRGAMDVPRSLLEFKGDPEIPAHERELASGKRLVLFCASGGWAALAAKTLKDMRVECVAHVPGGDFDEPSQAGAPTTGWGRRSPAVVPDACC